MLFFLLFCFDFKFYLLYFDFRILNLLLNVFFSNFKPKSINVFSTFFFSSIWHLFFYITIFLRDFCQTNSFFLVLSSNTGLVVNWESWLSLVGLCRAHNRGDRFKKLTRVILVFLSFDVLYSIIFLGFFKNYHGLMDEVHADKHTKVCLSHFFPLDFFYLLCCFFLLN